jgi:hypothetical protein
MPSNFSTIGFNINTEREFEDLVMTAAKQGESIQAGGITYIRWDASDGAELWVQISKAGEIIGANPHFRGKAKLTTSVTKRVRRQNDSVLDGAFHCWANPADAPESGNYPFVFDCPHAALFADTALPLRTTLQLAAFAHEISVYDSQEHFYATQDSKLPLAAESFIPSGLFMLDERKKEEPESTAIFAGSILATEAYTNPAGRGAYVWALVKTLGGEVDVVADRALLPSLPVVGGIMTGSFWLSGRMEIPKQDTPQRKPGLLNRLFGRS